MFTPIVVQCRAMLIAAALCSLSAAEAQLVGPEFPVNTFTGGHQERPEVAVDGDGNFIVVWDSDGQDGSGKGIVGRRFDAGANPLGPEFPVNAHTTDDQIGPSITARASGEFVVAWVDIPASSARTVQARRFDALGNPLGDDFQLNNEEMFSQFGPQLSMASTGAFVVVWGGYGDDSTTFDVFARRFDVAGAPLGDQFRVNSDTGNFQFAWSVAQTAAGQVIVSWSGINGPSALDVFGQRYDSAGLPLGGNFQVNTYTTGSQGSPSVAADGSGGFIVVWGSDDQDGSGGAVIGLRFDANGDPLGAEFPVNTYTTADQQGPSVVSDGSSGFVVVWESDGQDGDSWGVFGQRLDSSGDPVGGEFQVNSHTAARQYGAELAAIGASDFIVVWTSLNQDGSGDGVFGQRYGLTLFEDGFESGDTSAWSNSVP